MGASRGAPTRQPRGAPRVRVTRHPTKYPQGRVATRPEKNMRRLTKRFLQSVIYVRKISLFINVLQKTRKLSVIIGNFALSNTHPNLQLLI
jgi:hypothetical protein